MKSFLTIFLIILLSVSCNMKTDTPSNLQEKREDISEINFIHTVFFWLKEDVGPAQRDSFESGLYDLGEVPTIRKYFIATPADTDRDVIDNSYDYAWIAHFANAEDQAHYQTDSLHLEFIEKYSTLWEKVVVYDSDVIGRRE